jgi:putative transposase
MGVKYAQRNMKAIKIRLYPNKTQKNYMKRLCGSYRKVHNMCLEKKINDYNLNKSNLGLKELSNYFHHHLIINKDFSYLKEHNTKVLKQSIIDIMNAYKRFYINNNGFPQYKSKHNKQSCRFPLESISKTNTYLDNKITLTKQLKKIKFECSERDKNYISNHKDKVRSATLTITKSDKCFLSILIDNVIIKSINKPEKNIVGIDIGIKNFMTCSDGKIFHNLNLKKSNLKKLIKLQKQLCKKKIGSKNRNRARIRLAKLYEKLNNIKINYIHNITTQLVRENQTIVIENLNVKGMLKNQYLSKSIQDLSINETFRQLKYKCDWYDKDLIVIDKWFPSSKLCSTCGHKYKKLSLKEREWICPICETKHDRDNNASINIENEGKRILGLRCPEITLADYPLMDEHHENDLRSNDREKQEKICNI